jgi:hypothetical protein
MIEKAEKAAEATLSISRPLARSESKFLRRSSLAPMR